MPLPLPRDTALVPVPAELVLLPDVDDPLPAKLDVLPPPHPFNAAISAIKATDLTVRFMAVNLIILIRIFLINEIQFLVGNAADVIFVHQYLGRNKNQQLVLVVCMRSGSE